MHLLEGHGLSHPGVAQIFTVVPPFAPPSAFFVPDDDVVVLVLFESDLPMFFLTAVFALVQLSMLQ